ncbi:DUF302 domain-containing protein [Thiohalocapsa sp. ML1]|jgi:uncharacterized protein (DUF302 family)|uniref:DUF302 domain-containing protein n=1 Tax=Thiohalocapsa sp. ML1 TaxID=1431688 RepID=UPI0007322875|nr:DUF302 domain-containing protein [Thiohalocapsa sp. ML1]
MYGVSTKVSTGFDETIERVTEALKTQGFGVLSDIDVSATLKNKLGVDLRPYRILGACNPDFAHKAISAEPDIGVLLPCNFVVREDDAGDVHVLFMNPLAVLDLVENPQVPGLAEYVREKLDLVMEAVKS